MPSMPVYWKYEQSGKMKEIVHKFLGRQTPVGAESMPIKPPGYGRVMIMDQNELTAYLSGELLEYGIDPL